MENSTRRARGTFDAGHTCKSLISRGNSRFAQPPPFEAAAVIDLRSGNDCRGSGVPLRPCRERPLGVLLHERPIAAIYSHSPTTAIEPRKSSIYGPCEKRSKAGVGLEADLHAVCRDFNSAVILGIGGQVQNWIDYLSTGISGAGQIS